MDKKELNEFRALVYEVKKLQRNLETLEDSIYAPKAQKFSHTPHSHSGNGKTMDDLVCGHIELIELYKAKLAEKNSKLLRIEQAIDSLEDTGERLVMRHRYIDGWGWDRICSDLRPLGYSERTVYRLHGQALVKLRDV